MYNISFRLFAVTFQKFAVVFPRNPRHIHEIQKLNIEIHAEIESKSITHTKSTLDIKIDYRYTKTNPKIRVKIRCPLGPYEIEITL